MNTDPTLPARSRWKAVLLLLLVFMLGAGCGVGGGLLVLRSVLRRAIATAPGEVAPADFVVDALDSKIGRELELDEPQRQAIHAELMLTAGQFKALREHVTHETRTYVEDALTRSARHLPAEKHAHLRELVSRRLQPWGLMPAAK